jgi:hypothetical protein
VLGAVLVAGGGLGAGCGSSAAGSPDASFGRGEPDARGHVDVSTAHDAGHGPHPRDARAERGQADTGVWSLADAGECPDASALDAALAFACAGKCGPVVSRCTGEVVFCGGCAQPKGPDGGVGPPLYCNLATSICGPLETTCADLGAECGTVMTSCGTFIDCPDGPLKGCPTGEQCDTDTDQCQPCQPVTCADLGLECGLAWLGCGPDDTSNYTDCGTCGGGQVCNAVFNLCEPACAPAAASVLCSAAGAQCGVITDGCGGTVDCDTVAGLGCPGGESCGVQGEANQCDPSVNPWVCEAFGRDCGTLSGVCSGPVIDCGDCPAGQVCSAVGVCGPPCTPKTCATGYPGECGTGLSDACSGAIDCPCSPGSDVCTTAGGAASPPPAGTPGTCCAALTEASYTSKGECGTALPDGCGQDVVDAYCPEGECVDNLTGSPGAMPPAGTIGSCCVPDYSCAGVAAGICAFVADTCYVGAFIACNDCPPPEVCAGAGECCAPYSCANVPGGPGTAGGAACGSFDDGCGGILPCGCPGGQTCDTQTSPATCCTPTPCPSPPAIGAACGAVSDGCGNVNQCACPTGPDNANTTCTAGVCVCTPATCDGQVGNGIPDGCGGTINCQG